MVPPTKRTATDDPESPSYAESEFLPLSGLQHLVFCERQCALIHLERLWVENRLTAEGRVLHKRVDEAPGESRVDVSIARGVELCSIRLGLHGRADVVEFHRVDDGSGVRRPGVDGLWTIYPVEYKRGSPKWIDCDRVQLCAQAMCLEEMFDTTVPSGALFYARTRRREEVVFGVELRCKTQEAATRFHAIIVSGRTPVVPRAPKCKSCSLLDHCLPPKRGQARASRYLATAVGEHLR